MKGKWREVLDTWRKESKLIPVYQFGFRNQLTTIQQVHIKLVLWKMPQQELCTAILLDVMKAFDSLAFDSPTKSDT